MPNGHPVLLRAEGYGLRADWRRRVGIEPTFRRFRDETTVLKTAGATRPHSPPRGEKSADDNIQARENAFALSMRGGTSLLLAAEPWATTAAGRAGYRTRAPTKNPLTFSPGLRPVSPPFEM